LGPSKAFVPLGGRPLVWWGLQALRRSPLVQEIILIVRAQDTDRARRLIAQGPAHLTEKVVVGGEERQASVLAGLEEVTPGTEVVLVHDAARPFLDQELIAACHQAALETGAALAAVPAADTVKWAPQGARVERTLDRGGIWLAQTPQAFRLPVLLEAYQAAGRDSFTGTDDAGLVERLGRPVALVPGRAHNIKITQPWDLQMAEHIAAELGLAPPGLRTGLGYDLHPLVPGRPLVLAGVRFDSPRGLAGHSDADVVAHAVTDALLGAAALGDIGQLFPDTDERYRGADSLELLAQATGRVREAGWAVLNVDAIVICQEPKVAPHAAQMRANLARALGASPEAVSIKGKTSEGLGFLGRGEAIACHAVAALYRTGIQP